MVKIPQKQMLHCSLKYPLVIKCGVLENPQTKWRFQWTVIYRWGDFPARHGGLANRNLGIYPIRRQRKRLEHWSRLRKDSLNWIWLRIVVKRTGPKMHCCLLYRRCPASMFAIHWGTTRALGEPLKHNLNRLPTVWRGGRNGLARISSSSQD